ncbi:MAG: urate hydroxylase PuuD, partial [Myxococcota bacterium]
PMLFFMGAARHLSIVNAEMPNYHVYFGVVLILVALFEANVFVGNAAVQKLLATVSGTIHLGLALTLVLYLAAEVLL